MHRASFTRSQTHRRNTSRLPRAPSTPMAIIRTQALTQNRAQTPPTNEGLFSRFSSFVYNMCTFTNIQPTEMREVTMEGTNKPAKRVKREKRKKKRGIKYTSVGELEEGMTRQRIIRSPPKA